MSFIAILTCKLAEDVVVENHYIWILNYCMYCVGAQVLVQHEGECCGQPPADPAGWEGAVCATNGRTYPDTSVISLMRKFGQCEYSTQALPSCINLTISSVEHCRNLGQL